jgi:hypothetical protein
MTVPMGLMVIRRAGHGPADELAMVTGRMTGAARP